MNFMEKLQLQFEDGRIICVGLDPVVERIPSSYLPTKSIYERLYGFNCSIINATKSVAAAFKPNGAFYRGVLPLSQPDARSLLKETIAYGKEVAPDIPWIGDFKCGDTIETNRKHAHYAFEYLNLDAITVHPAMGKYSLTPFLERHDKGMFVVCRSSEIGSEEFQDLPVLGSAGTQRLYEVIAQRVTEHWNEHSNCGLVVGATALDALAQVRALAPDVPILCPGNGAQGGKPAEAYLAGKDAAGAGILISASRSILYASSEANFAQAAFRAAAQLSSLALAKPIPLRT